MYLSVVHWIVGTHFTFVPLRSDMLFFYTFTRCHHRIAIFPLRGLCPQDRINTSSLPLQFRYSRQVFYLRTILIRLKPTCYYPANNPSHPFNLQAVLHTPSPPHRTLFIPLPHPLSPYPSLTLCLISTSLFPHS